MDEVCLAVFKHHAGFAGLQDGLYPGNQVALSFHIRLVVPPNDFGGVRHFAQILAVEI